MKLKARRKTSKIAPLIALAVLLTIPLYYPFKFPHYSPNNFDRHQDSITPTISHSDDQSNTDNPYSGELDSPPCNDVVGDGNVETMSHHKEVITTPNYNKPPQKDCDLFSGEWVPNPEGPYYTNETCYAIQEHQNCMRFGRPDTGFLKWRWKPDECELPIFDPRRFLELVRGRSLAFVGDSVARNHMQSLICLLSRVSTKFLSRFNYYVTNFEYLS